MVERDLTIEISKTENGWDWVISSNEVTLQAGFSPTKMGATQAVCYALSRRFYHET